MLRMEKVTAHSAALPQILQLYKRAFPVIERAPIGLLLDDPTGASDFVAFYDGATFCGFACMLTLGSLTHVLYFAIEDALRGRGYGALALDAMLALRPGSRYIVDIEELYPGAPNLAQRRRRRRFYLKNGYAPSGVRYRWQHENYEILVRGGALTQREFDDFWRYFESENSRFAPI